MTYPNQLAGLPLEEEDARRLGPQLADWTARAARLDRWVRDNVPLSTPGITTVGHDSYGRRS